MFKPLKKSLAQQQKPKTTAVVEGIAGLAIVATALAVLATVAVLVSASPYAKGQDRNHDNDKYSLVSPGGIAFSDFKGYEDWATASSARQDDILKVIVANPTM